ncbi:hypothetical protein MPTK1_7g17740 [Marchantia polymorpha subsp. ruderalis]|uniref:Carbohydrate kinase PfkB domain-containing protein n=2 Tax=Marchantia polymorpha TaxID=3197 RepID=A0A176WQ64_MARPO|nr:hypothetical protein AXG93_392s1070 [Marchantia polymorpha subsp. ruderalis]PTQ38512.1 hypothetical protein MARPO_0051s0110 [Marchantia polymorpha]BBN17888.1 hypothetical protein Mp_7g17740 [Marchantia polymorpha subsp. ruderalis]|eukprot:PTQ38512.1 hypothetical protein MARPO_0051s0110 [Marchantia polymorpha]
MALALGSPGVAILEAKGQGFRRVLAAGWHGNGVSGVSMCGEKQRAAGSSIIASASRNHFRPNAGARAASGAGIVKNKAASPAPEKKERSSGLSDGEETDGASDVEDGEEDYDWPPLVCCFGEALHEFLPSVRVSERKMDPEIYSTWKGLQWSPPEFARLPGSVPSNVAVALARLGARVAFMGKVGDDEHGHDIVLKLNTDGVQTRGVKFDKNASTGVSRLQLTTESGKVRMTCVKPSAEDSFTKNDINKDILKEAKFFQFTSISLTAEPLRSSLLSAIRLAQRNGAEIYFDVNLPLPFWDSVDLTRESIKGPWKEATIVEVTKHEIEFILGEEEYELRRQRGPTYASNSVAETKNRRYHYHYDPEELAPLWHNKLKMLIVTDGTHRIHYYTPHFHGEVAGTEDVLVAPFSCDRTGSGDAVTAAIIRKLSTQPELFTDEVKLQKALRFAVCAGIIAQWTIGAIRGMPTESAAQNLTEQVYPASMIF